MWATYKRILSFIVLKMALLAGISLLAIIAITSLDIILRRFGLAVRGAVDLVQILCCLSVAFALPYTTGVKGHIAVEYLFKFLGKRGKVVFDTISRCLVIALFSILAYFSLTHGFTLLEKKSLTLTLNIPWFWVYWMMSFSFLLVVLVTIYHLTHPGKELLRL